MKRFEKIIVDFFVGEKMDQWLKHSAMVVSFRPTRNTKSSCVLCEDSACEETPDCQTYISFYYSVPRDHLVGLGRETSDNIVTLRHARAHVQRERCFTEHHCLPTYLIRLLSGDFLFTQTSTMVSQYFYWS